MKLIGNLKKKVENAETKEEAKEAIKKAGMLLDEDELEQVSGGMFFRNNPGGNSTFCPKCGKYITAKELGLHILTCDGNLNG